jgi:hypothetical protein
MINIIINEKEYNIPQSWNEVTLKQQIELSQIKDRDDLFKNLFMVQTYTGIPMEIVKKMNINEFKQILSNLKFLTEQPKSELIKDFKLNGNTYYVSDSLLKGETQDFLSIEAVLQKYKDNEVKALPYIIAVICKQKGESLDSYDVEKRALEFELLDYQTANNIWFFFAQTEVFFSKNIKFYLNLQDKQMTQSLNYTENIIKKSAGGGLWKKLHKAILLQYVKYISKSWKNFYHISSSETSKENSKIKFKKNQLKTQKEKSNIFKRLFNLKKT